MLFPQQLYLQYGYGGTAGTDTCRSLHSYGQQFNAIGGTSTILIGIALAASSAMCLPISTPPNAIAYSTGLIKQNDMLKAGLTVGVISMIIGYVVLFFVGESHFLG